MATISDPPVEAPHFNVIPTPKPPITPPKTAFNIISLETVKTGSTSRKAVVATIDNTLYKVKRRPTLNQPTNTTGIFNSKSQIPDVIKEIPRYSTQNVANNCAIPVNPAAYTPALIQKKFKATALINAPRMTTVILLAS